jgi:hypothetical protein
MTETTLNFFEDEDDLKFFAATVGRTYLAMMQCSELGGLSTGDARKAVLLSRLVLRMLDYKRDRAAEMAISDGGTIAAVDVEADKLWPLFQEKLDEELREAQRFLELARCSGVETVQ